MNLFVPQHTPFPNRYVHESHQNLFGLNCAAKSCRCLRSLLSTKMYHIVTHIPNACNARSSRALIGTGMFFPLPDESLLSL